MLYHTVKKSYTKKKPEKNPPGNFDKGKGIINERFLFFLSFFSFGKGLAKKWGEKREKKKKKNQDAVPERLYDTMFF
jgi:hypothetical protein